MKSYLKRITQLSQGNVCVRMEWTYAIDDHEYMNKVEEQICPVNIFWKYTQTTVVLILRENVSYFLHIFMFKCYPIIKSGIRRRSFYI